jgi:FkbM family methyltransferase
MPQTRIPSQAYGSALSAVSAGNLAEAERLCQQVIASGHDDFDAVHLLANIQSKQGDKEAALASYDRALELQPDHADALNGRGAALHELERFEEALASYDRALAVEPDFAMALNNRGVTLQQLKRFDDALASYDRALQVLPHYLAALCNRGVVQWELKRFEDALATYDRVLAARPDDAGMLSNRGAALRALKRFDEALESYDRALALRPEFAEALVNRGNTLRELKRLEEAVACYDRALALRPDLGVALINRGKTLRALKRFETVTTAYGKMAIHGDDRWIGYCLRKFGQYNQAEIDLFGSLVKKHDTVLDVGANIGAFTVPLARLVGNEGRVMAYEPHPEHYALLIENIRSYACASAFRYGLGERRESVSVPPLSSLGHRNYGSVELKPYDTADAEDTFDVEVVPLDAVGLDHFDFMKIDVEGMEEAVIRGGRATIERCRPVIYMEIERDHARPYLIELMQSLDYVLFEHRPGLFSEHNFNNVSIDSETFVVSVNMLCLPRERHGLFADVVAARRCR